VFFGSLGKGIPYLLYYPAVMAAALYGGLWAGFLATALSSLLVFLWIQHGLMTAVESLALAIFIISCTLISFVSRAERRAEVRSKLAREITEVANQKLRGEAAMREQTEMTLRETKEYLENLIGYANAPIIVWDANGKITSFNHAFEEIAGQKAEQVLGHGLDFLFAVDERERAMGIVRRASAGERLELVEVPIHHASGIQRTILWNSAPIFSADKKRQIATIAQGQDITKRIQAQAETQQLNNQLEQRVRDRTAELEAANRELEAFSYSVSHDLRAPLRAMDGFSMALLENCRGKLDPASQRNLERIRANSQRMAELIDDLLKLAHLSRDAMLRERVDLTAMAEEIGAELQDAETGRVVELVVAPALIANADKRMMRVVLNNLLGNAWKFTGKTAPARVEVGAREQRGERQFFVRDNGAGFDMAYADKLFGAFQRLHSTSEFDGNGIGLALVERIVHRHGGRAWAEGAVGLGATLHFTLGTERN
jgi:PAS domain S-box-containing protein